MQERSAIPTVRRGVLAAIAAGACFFTPKAEAVLTFNFGEINGDVVAALSGTLSLAGGNLLTDDSVGPASTTLTALSTAFLNLPANVPYDIYFSSESSTQLSASPTSTTVTSPLGWQVNNLYVDSSASDDGSVSPTGTFTWEDQTLEDIGLGSLREDTPVTAMTVFGSNDQVQYVRGTIPEPSVALLSALGLMGLACRRRVRG